MKINFVVVALLTFFSGFAQEINKAQLKAEQNANTATTRANGFMMKCKQGNNFE